MRISTIGFLLAALWSGLATPAAAGSAKTVVELFTSQGCSSCPPADAFLSELARRDDVLALSYHVEYWNYLGWRDPFSSPEATARQRAYRRSLALRYVYTPQIVVGGAVQAVGSSRDKVLGLIAAQRGKRDLEMAIVERPRGRATITIGAGPRQSRPAAVWLLFYDKRRVTEIRRGENRGARLTNTNVVRVFRRIGSWTGKAMEITVSLEELGARGRDACAVIVQQDGNGPILGAMSFPLPWGTS